MSSKYPKRSIPALRAEIETVKVRNYEGADGLGSYFSNLADLILDMGVMVVPDIATLAALGGFNARIVAVKNVAMYVYNPSVQVTNNPLNYPASGGGYWEFLCALGKTSYEEVIGDSILTVFTITHNLNTLTPTVVQVQTLTGLAKTYGLTGTVEIVDANSLTITYTTAPGSFQYTIAVKK